MADNSGSGSPLIWCNNVQFKLFLSPRIARFVVSSHTALLCNSEPDPRKPRNSCKIKIYKMFLAFPFNPRHKVFEMAILQYNTYSTTMLYYNIQITSLNVCWTLHLMQSRRAGIVPDTDMNLTFHTGPYLELRVESQHRSLEYWGSSVSKYCGRLISSSGIWLQTRGLEFSHSPHI